ITRIVSAPLRSTTSRSASSAWRPLVTSFLYCSFSAGRVKSCRCECGAATAPTSGIDGLLRKGIRSAELVDWLEPQRLGGLSNADALGLDGSGELRGAGGLQHLARGGEARRDGRVGGHPLHVRRDAGDGLLRQRARPEQADQAVEG